MTAPERFVRFYPKRWAQLRAALTPMQLAGYVALLMHLVQRDGVLPDDDKLLATLAGLPPSVWREAREKLLALNYARIEAGHWIDDDQAANVERQLATSERQRQRAIKRHATPVELRRA